MPSVLLRVKTISRSGAPMNAPMVARAASYAPVASSASWCAPRCGAALMFS
jgi:hypothetical protein